MIDQFAEQCVGALYLAFLASWRALPVFVVVAVLAFVLRKRVPARYLCWLWLIVIARLLLPFSAHSTLAISSVADVTAQRLISGNNEVQSESTDFDTFTYRSDEGKSVTVALLPPGATPEQQAAADAIAAKIDAEEIAAKKLSAANAAFNQIEGDESFIDSIEPVLVILSYSVVFGFPAIAILMLLRGIGSYLRFARKIWSAPSITDQATVDCLLRICDDLQVGRRPQIKEVKTLNAPAMFGLLRPVICLPAGWRDRMTNEELGWVFRHEVAHVKGHDGLLLSIATLARSLQWFNPLSWVAVSNLQQSMERAADELATLHLDATQLRQYGELLIQFAASQHSTHKHPTIGLLAMAAPKGLHRRIESLGTPVVRLGWFRSAIAIAVISLVSIGGLTDAKSNEDFVTASRPVPDGEVAKMQWNPQTPNDANIVPPKDWKPRKDNQDTTKRSVSINVEAALRKARELQPGIDAERFLVTYFAPYNITEDRPAGSYIVNGVMTVELTKQQERLMKQMLSGFEQSGLWQVVTELRIIDTDIRLLDQFDWSASESTASFARLDRSPVLDDEMLWDKSVVSLNALPMSSTVDEEHRFEEFVSMPIRAAKISRIQAERLIHQVQKDARSNILQAPKVTVFNGQRATVSDVANRPFVTDVVEIVGQNATALQPKISVIEEGWKFLFETTVTAEQQTDLRMVLTKATIESVKLANLPTGRNNSHDERATIQVPTVKTDSIAVQTVLDASETLLIFSPKPYDHDSAEKIVEQGYAMGQVIMIRTQILSDNESLKDFVPD